MSKLPSEAYDAPAAVAAGSLVWPVERVIRPERRRIRLADLLRERTVIRVLASRDFKVKYKQSLLGPLWLVFQPLALLFAFLIGFRGLGGVNTAGVPYLAFALVGLCPWAFFQAAMTIGTSSLISNINFIRFTPCPRPAFPLASVIASLPSFGVTALGAIVATAVTGHLGVRALLFPLILVWLLALTLGVVGVSSSLAVRYRDVISALPFILQLGLFVAPVGYPLGDLSPEARFVVELNPLTGILEAARWMLISGYDLRMTPVYISVGVTAVLLVIGWRRFTRLETTMADEI